MKVFRSLIGATLVAFTFNATATETTSNHYAFTGSSDNYAQLAYFDAKRSVGHFRHSKTATDRAGASAASTAAKACARYQHAPKRLSIYKKRYCKTDNSEA